MQRLKRWLALSWRDTGITLASLLVVTALCVLLNRLGDSDNFAPLLYVMAILVIARLTDGYFYGIAAAIVCVVGVNYAFTYPYWAFNFTISGYPLTFFCLLVVSIFTSTLTTRIKEQERERSENEKEIVRANLLRSISHDFRTPLTTIIGSANAMLDKSVLVSDAERTIMLQTIADEAEWLKRIVENLMSITRVNSGSGGLKKSAEMAEEILSEAAQKFRRQGLPVEVEIVSPDELLFVPMDATLIGQVLQNLLDNAVRHGKNTRHIVLSVERDGMNAAFSVRDDGEGIPEPKLSHLLAGKPLAPDSGDLSDDARNLGIGLSVCRTILTAHGGSMTVKNNCDRGATIRFVLPLEEGENI